MLNNFELKVSVEKNTKTKLKNPKVRYSYNQSDLTSALNSTFMKMEHSLSNARSKKSLTSSHQNGNQSSLQKDNLKMLEMEIGMTDFGGPDFNMDLDQVQRAEDIVNENFQKVKDGHEQSWFLPEEMGFNKNALSEDKNIFKKTFTFSRDFNNQLKNMKQFLSRSKLKNLYNFRKRTCNGKNCRRK